MNVDDLEAEIDRLVYELYGVTEEEIAIVEGKGPTPNPSLHPKGAPKRRREGKMVGSPLPFTPLVHPKGCGRGRGIGPHAPKSPITQQAVIPVKLQRAKEMRRNMTPATHA